MGKDVTVLGIHDGHDSGAALIRNGRVLAAVAEERLVKIKHYSGTPENAIKQVFKISGVHPSEVDIISIASLNRAYAPNAEEPFKLKVFELISPLVASHSFSNFYVNILSKQRSAKHLFKIFNELGLKDIEVDFVEHHEAHAWSAYQSCPWDEALVLTSDGAGDGLSSTVNIGRNGSIERIASSTYYDSIGNAFYSEITAYLGMKRWDHEFKTMGLAPYGKPEYCKDVMEKIVRLNPNNGLEFQNISGACNRQVQKKLKKLLDGQRFDNIAAAAQQHLEELLCAWVSNAIKATGINKVAFAGGVMLNVKASKFIYEMPEVEDVFTYPAADDSGMPVGAALKTYYDYCKRDGIKPEKVPITDVYYGSNVFNEDVEAALKNSSWKADFYDDISGAVGEQLAKGKVIAWCNGRMEYGPRALGCRSIIADARDPDVRRKLNMQVKMRDWFMPFAPSMLDERKQDYLIDPRRAPYMTMAFDTTENWRDIEAGTHPQDRTARPHTVDKEWNPGYWKVIKSFEEITGIGAVLNTSFNLHGYPNVCNPEQAIWTLDNSGLDGLAVGNYLILR
jgi:carbamoyltransferase